MECTLRVPAWAAQLASDHTDMTRAPRPLDPEVEPHLRITLPDDAYFEYAFLDRAGRMRADPANDARGENPWYPEVSVLRGPRYRADPLAEPPEPRAAHAIERLRIASERLHQTRRIIVATPAAAAGADLPWVLVQDGVAFYRLARLADVLAALMERGEARAARLVFVEPVERSREYAFHDGYRDFVTEELLPELQGRFGWSGELAALGVSLGGLFSAWLGLQRPDLVRTVVTLSGAFQGHPEAPDFFGGERSWVAEHLEGGDPAPPRWYAEVGTLEWLTDVNRRVRGALEERGLETDYRERNAGHNWTNWRNGLGDALRFALRP